MTQHSVKKRKALRKWILKAAIPQLNSVIPQSQNIFAIPNATPCIEFGLNMHDTGHVGPTIRIFYVTQPLSFVVFNSVDS